MLGTLPVYLPGIHPGYVRGVVASLCVPCSVQCYTTRMVLPADDSYSRYINEARLPAVRRGPLSQPE